MKYLAVDTETTGLGYFDKAFAVTTAWIDDEQNIQSRFFSIPEDNEHLQRLLEQANTFVFHNAKFDLVKLQMAGIWKKDDLPAFQDTEAIFHLLYPNKPKRLKILAKTVLGIEPVEEELLKKEMRKLKIKKSDGYHKIPLEVLKPYAVKDAEYTILLFNKLYPQLLRHKDLLSLYDMERELTWVLMDMERQGMGIDRTYVRETKISYAKKVIESEILCRDITRSEAFNPRSNKQIKEYFEERGVIRESYDKNSLMEIKDPLASTLLSLRSDEKTLSTYISPMYEESSTDGLLHPHFRQYVAASGRLSSGAAQG